jgi:hypothetical protein
VLVLLLLSLLPGCGDCWSDHITTDCQVAGTVQGQFSDGTTYANSAPGLGSCPSRPSLGDPYGPGPATMPEDLITELSFDARRSIGDITLVDLKLTIHSVAPGSSEIDLDDTRAAIQGYSGLQGHISIAVLSQDCSHGSYSCLIELHATLTVSAVSSFGDSVSLTAATLDVSETYARVKIMCAQVGE